MDTYYRETEKYIIIYLPFEFQRMPEVGMDMQRLRYNKLDKTFNTRDAFINNDDLIKFKQRTTKNLSSDACVIVAKFLLGDKSILSIEQKE